MKKNNKRVALIAEITKSLALMFQANEDAIIAINSDQEIVFFNTTAEKIFGFTALEVIGQPINILLSLSSLPTYQQNIAEFIQSPQLTFQTNIDQLFGQQKNGTEFPINASICKIVIAKQAILTIVFPVNTSQFNSQRLSLNRAKLENSIVESNLALIESEGFIKSIIDSAMDGIIVLNSEQKIILFNKTSEQMFGYKAQEMLGQSLDRLIPQQFRRDHSKYIEQFGQANITRRSMAQLGDVYGVRANGEEFPLEASISHRSSQEQKVYMVILRDVTIRKQNEKELKEQALKLQTQAQIIQHARILIRDIDDKIILWNKGVEQLYGWQVSEAVGQVCYLLLKTKFPEPLATIKETLFKTGEWKGELVQLSKDGQRVVVSTHWVLHKNSNNEPVAILEVNDDITEKKKLENQLFRSQRMESIGTLAGGIAHDLNNVLTPIIMGLQLITYQISDEESRKMISALVEHAQRGSDMVKQVLSFAKGVEGERILLQPRYLVSEIQKILVQILPKNIEIKITTPKNIWAITGNVTQLNQVLMNICINARDAMPQGGQLVIKMANITIDEYYAKMQYGATPGPFVVITITDTGEGMPENILHRIFEPFFTTKEMGKGTGLGLSTALAIIKSHKGFITVYSEIARGTTFSIYLPASLMEKDLLANEDVSDKKSVGKGEEILVIDDEALIRQITKTTLEAHGYKVITANDGAEGVAVYAINKARIKVVLLDMMMPNLDGQATSKILQQIEPKVKIIISSGFAPHAKMVEGNTIKAFISKPYTAEQLLEVITQVLQSD